MFGVQNVLPAWPALLKALASVEIAPPIALNREVLKEDEVRMTWGNEVALGVGLENDTPADVPTPWRASDHH